MKHRFDFKISKNNIDYYKYYNLDYNEIGLTEKLKADIERGKPQPIEKYIEAIEKSPKNPFVYQILIGLYVFKKEIPKATELAKEFYNKFPEFIDSFNFLVGFYSDQNRLDFVEKMFDNKFEINELYPDRKVYFWEEVINFYFNVIDYYILKKNPEKAREIAIKLSDILDDKEYLDILFKMINDLKKEVETEQLLKDELKLYYQKFNIVQTTEAPVFNHSEINDLYKYGLDIDQQIIQNILQLPRKTLIEDLEKVLFDCIYRFDYFYDKYDTFNFDEQTFAIHAFILLADLEANESIDIVLKLISFDRDVLEYWFTDFIFEYAAFLLTKIENKNLEKYTDFIKNTDALYIYKSIIAETINKIVFMDSTRRAEAIDWYKDIFNYFLQNNRYKNEEINLLLHILVANLMDLRAVELVDLVSDLFDKNIIKDIDNLTFNNFLSEVNIPLEDFDIDYEISEFYEDLIEWREDLELEDDDEDEDYDDDDEDYEVEENEDNYSDYEEVKTPFVIPESEKIGRNDPCSCGSGKKYKKCCGKNF